MRSSWPGCFSSSSAARTDNAPEVIAGQNVQIGDKGLPALLGSPYEPRNHAVFFRRCGSVPSLCIRCGHDPAHFLRGWTGREALVRDVVWAEGPLGRGHSTSTGAVHAFGDRMAVPERVDCTRQCRMSPVERAFCPRHVPHEGRSASPSAEEMSGIVSTSDTKARNGPTPTKENRMIPRFIWKAEEHWRSFVTVLDILARDRLRCVVSARCRARREAPRP